MLLKTMSSLHSSRNYDLSEAEWKHRNHLFVSVRETAVRDTFYFNGSWGNKSLTSHSSLLWSYALISHLITPFLTSFPSQMWWRPFQKLPMVSPYKQTKNGYIIS